DFNEEMLNAGVMLAGEGLHPSSEGARVYFRGGKRTVTDGPFAETKELIAGFWLIEVDSLKEAIDWAKRVPDPMGEGEEAQIEIRRVYELDEFSNEILTPEERAREESMRDRLETGAAVL
ncbi:MAG: YciI family protein, partial [Anaerolineae bacterium]|nr:YciI family protein [Anaerolineae bacterium]